MNIWRTVGWGFVSRAACVRDSLGPAAAAPAALQARNHDAWPGLQGMRSKLTLHTMTKHSQACKVQHTIHCQARTDDEHAYLAHNHNAQTD